jgi:acetyl/propionyl-CoA carboxylase alpha subunit
MLREISVDGGEPHEVRLTRRGDSATLWLDGRAVDVALRDVGAGLQVQVDGIAEAVWVATSGDTVFVHAFGRAWEIAVVDPAERSGRGGGATDVATAPMPGVVVAINVEAGDQVTEGQSVVLIESMKMQTQIAAPRDGVVERVHLRLGDQFERGAALVTLVVLDEDGH